MVVQSEECVERVEEREEPLASFPILPERSEMLPLMMLGGESCVVK